MNTPNPCEAAQQALSDLLAGELDEGAEAELEAHLASCDACKLVSVNLLRQDRALSEMGVEENVGALRAKIRTKLELPEQAPNKKKSKIHKFRIRPRVGQGSSFWSITAGIAALLVVGVLVVFYMKPTAYARLTFEGAVTINKQSAKNNAELEFGETIDVPANAHATLRFINEDTILGLESGSVSVSEVKGGAGSLQSDSVEVTLKSGSLSAQVAHQPRGKTFLVKAPEASVLVIGTKFQLSTKPDQTQLIVDEGKVKFVRKSDQASVDVPAQHYAVAKENAPLVALAKQEQLTNPAKEQRKRLVTVAEHTEFKKLAAEHLDAVKAVVQTFKPDTFTQGKTTIPYRLFSPETVMAGTQFPLVIFLHGIGGNGKDNLKQVTDVPFGPGVWALAENQARHPCFVLAPQVNNWDPNSAQVVMELIDELIQKHPIDKRRVYVTGVSSGAYGTYLLLQARPIYFAAALPVSGWIPDAKKMNTYAHVPLWIFHGEQDKTINPGNSRKAFDDFSALGADVRFDEYEKAGHGIFEEVYSQPELMEWVFKRSL